MSTNEIGVVYLARHADGIAAFRRFARSYAHLPAGVAHDLIVIYKGFKRAKDAEAARAAFDGLPHVAIAVPDVGFDIGAYAEASRRVTHEYLAFFNTHTEILVPNWLAHLHGHASRTDFGAVGTMGSYESIRSTVLLLRSAIWKSVGVGKRYDRWLAHYFDFVLRQYHPGWYGPSGDVLEPIVTPPGRVARLLQTLARKYRRASFDAAGTALIWRGAPSFDFMQFPAFPNPHLRSNGFMMRRERFLGFDLPSIPSKFETSLFESGADSMTARLRARNLEVVVVGADGTAYGIADWWRSNTFRCGDQRNLLVADNHTRAFAEMSPGGRATHAWSTWGSFCGREPEHFPDLGVPFPMASLDAGETR